jgi:hypothetical protein
LPIGLISTDGSSHPGHLSAATEWDWLYKDFFLSILSRRKSTQRAAYRRYRGEEDREEITRVLSIGKWPPILGDEDSINRLKAGFFKKKINPQVPDSRFLAPEVVQIVRAVSLHYGIDEAELAKCRGGRFNEPRAVAVHLTRMIRKDSFADIASVFGLGSYSAVGAVLESMRKRQALDLKLNERCRLIQKTLTDGQTET